MQCTLKRNQKKSKGKETRFAQYEEGVRRKEECMKFSRENSAEDWLLGNRKLVELVHLGPGTMVHVWEWSNTSFSHGTTERLVLHLVVANVASWVVHRS